MKWEYCTLDFGVTAKNLDRLNALGIEGWEVCASMPDASTCGSGILILKRPRK